MRDVEDFRLRHSIVTRLRDDDLCQYHYRHWGLENVSASEVHHVYGRSAEPSLNETWMRMICLCGKHHRQFHAGNISQREMVGVLFLANEDPVDWNFLKKYVNNSTEATKWPGVHACLGDKREKDMRWFGNIGICPFCLEVFFK